MLTLAAAQLDDAERRTLERFVSMLREHLGEALISVWLYGSRARSERAHDESDIDLLVISEGGRARDQRLVADLSWQAAELEGARPAFVSARVWDPAYLRNRREIDSFFVQEVDRDKIVVYGEP